MQRNQSTARKQSMQHRQVPQHCDPVQIYKGKQRDGRQEFEYRIATACEQYERIKVALIRETTKPMRPIKQLDGGKMIAVYGDRTEPGFKGTLHSGRTVAFEVVFTDTDRIEKNQLTLRQEEMLDTYNKLDANVFILIGFSDGRCFRIPWSIWRDMQVIYERKHLKSSDLASYEVASGYINGKLCIEFLGKANFLVSANSVDYYLKS